MKDILRALVPLKNRMHLNILILCLFFGLVLAGALSFVLAYAGLIVPVPFLLQTIFWIYPSSLLLAILTALFLRPGNNKVIKTADSLGLKERLVTAYQLRDDRSPIARIQRYDALKSLSRADFGLLYPIRLPGRLGIAAAALPVLVAVSFIIPSMAREKAVSMEALLKEIRTQASQLDKERKELTKNSSLSEKKLQEMNKRIDELLKELRKSSSEGDAIKALSKTKHELEELKSNNTKSELSKLADSLSKNPATRELGEAIKKGDLTDIKQKLERMNESYKKLDESGKKALAEQIKKAARDVANSKELAQNLNDISSAISSGNLDALSGEMAELTESLSKLAAEDQDIADAMEEFADQMLDQLGNSLNKAKKKISSAAGSKGKYSKSNPGQGGQQDEEDSEDSENSGSSQEASSGSGGNQPGNQPGSQPGNKGGGGAGDSTSSKDLGYSGEESSPGSRQPGEKRVRDFESIYVPNRLGGDNTESQLSGKKNSSGQSQWTDGSAPVQKGSAVPYDKVLGEYKNEAMSNMKDSPVPPVMKDIVRDYFSTLE